ncbi:MAG TPA: 4a-hydroxytetrahydrobiopterin dehydratase [Gammaproteobacteria bacterium]|jgi:4a-hydroxytetrahydrobiopterin dehydratase|nr:4a-hydroxytetrahydrobiopterin dehydratase [Gammaproteobacteria bacterium]
MKHQKLSCNELKKSLTQLNSENTVRWYLEDEKLTKTFKFDDFNLAFEFMTRCATYAEQVNHHPEWYNVYGTVKVQLTTHDASGITFKDFAMATKMDSFGCIG